MNKRLLLAFALILSVGMAMAGKDTLKFKIKGVSAGTTINLAYYYGNKLYYSDTAIAKANGLVVFGGKKTYDPGLYAVVLPGNRYFEFLVNNETVEMETDTNDFSGNMVVKKSAENKLFYNYIKFLGNCKKEADPLREKLKTLDAKSAEAEDIRKKLNELDKKVRKEQDDIYEKNKTRLAAKIVHMSVDPMIPEAPKDANGKPIDTLFAYHYAKEHYWDHVDFTDERLVKCPSFHNKVENYFKNMVAQIPDTLIVEADRVVSKMLNNKEMFKYTVIHLTNYADASKIMCMDGLFVHMVFKYFKTGQAYWMDAERLKKINERAETIAPILCNVPVHPLSLMDTAGQKWLRLYDIDAEFTLLIFWDPECGHCKKELPKFADLYKKWKGKGLEIYAVSSDNNDKWRKFIRDNNMTFINVAAPTAVYSNNELAAEYIKKGYTDLKSLNYRTHFDIYSTPKVFLLDRNKRILAKQIEADQVENLIEIFRKRAIALSGGK